MNNHDELFRGVIRALFALALFFTARVKWDDIKKDEGRP